MKHSKLYATLGLLGLMAVTTGCDIIEKLPFRKTQPKAAVSELEKEIEKDSKPYGMVAGVGSNMGAAMESVSGLTAIPNTILEELGNPSEDILRDFNSPDITDNYPGIKYEVCIKTKKPTKDLDVNKELVSQYISGPVDKIERVQNTFVYEGTDITETVSVKENGFIVRYIARTAKGEDMVVQFNRQYADSPFLKRNFTKKAEGRTEFMKDMGTVFDIYMKALQD